MILPYVQIGLPVALALIMLSMGMTLRWADFARIVEYPRAFLIGISGQLLLVPLIAYAVIYVFHLPPLLAAGLMILSFCPGGTTSNLFSHIAKGNVPLSISLTAFASIITPFTIPILSELALLHFAGEAKAISIPLLLTIKRLAIITVLPVTIGIIWNSTFSDQCRHWQPRIYRLSVLLFMSVIAAMISLYWHNMPMMLETIGPAAIAMIVFAMLLAWLIAKVGKLTRPDRKTIAIEVGMQNGGMALVVTQGVLHNPAMSAAPIMYGLLMLIPVFVYSVTNHG